MHAVVQFCRKLFKFGKCLFNELYNTISWMKFYVYLYNTQVMKPTLLKTFVINEIIIILGKGKPF